MYALLRIAFVSFLLIVSSCGRHDTIRRNISTADSLAGSLGALSEQLRNTDTAAVTQMIRQYNLCVSFISGHAADTISRAQAEQLQRLSVAGRQLQSFLKNRLLLLERSETLRNQIKTLSADAAAGSIDTDLLAGYVQTEKKNAATFGEQAQAELRLYHSAVKQFNLAYPVVSDLVRSLNQGQWPSVFSDTSAVL